MFNEIEAVQSYLRGERIPLGAIDDCVFQIAKFCKDRDMGKIETKSLIIDWMKRNGINFTDLNNNIDNAYMTKSKLSGQFRVGINEEDINRINFAADFAITKKIALFLLVYAKIYADSDRKFNIRIATMAEWVGVAKTNIYNRHIKPLVEYGFMDNLKDWSYVKYLKNKREDKRMELKINHKLINDGDYFIERNEDFDELFHQIFK